MTQEGINKLKKELHMTKYCRINAYKRTKSWDSFLQCVLFISNLGIIAGSVLSVVFKWEIVSFIILILSISTFSLSLFISTKNFYAQSCEYKRAYNEIEHLEKLLNNSNPDYDLVQSKYDELISFSSNHDQQDLYRLKVEYFEDELVTGDDLKHGKDLKYWRKLYSKEVAKDFLVKSLTSLFIYPLFILFALAISPLVRLFKRNEEKWY